jgi:hypothetical protein
MNERIARACVIGSKLLPEGVRMWLRGSFSLSEVDRLRRAQRDPLAHQPCEHFAEGSPVKLGILKEYYSYHKDYVYACRELGISYRLIDLSADDWISRIEADGCDAYLAWPSPLPRAWKSMFDDRLRILSEELGRIVYPSVKECWLYESKLRTRDWLEAHRLPHPRTWVFHDRDEAIRFARAVALPIVFKTNIGASASGVRILRDRRRLIATIWRAFDKGIAPRGQGPVERQAGVVYLQEYLPNVKEWRMVRIGSSFFGYRKERGDGEFHSASHNWCWLDPPRPLLDLLRRVTETGQFTSMSVDVFETTDGSLLVNELHTVFGATTPVDQLRVNGKPGRYLYRETTDEWVFEEGDFSRNACSNLRLSYLLGTILARGGRGLSPSVNASHG